MQMCIQELIKNKAEIIDKALVWQQTHFPTRTTEYSKCTRDMSYVIDAYINDLANNSSNSVIYLGSKFWHNGKRQLIDYKSELEIHNYIIDYIQENVVNNIETIQKITALKDTLLFIIENGPIGHTLLDSVQSFQHCQRNWDLSKTVDDQTIDWLMDIGYNTPTKQNLDSFEIVCIKNREKIKKFSDAATNAPSERHALPEVLIDQLSKGRIQNPQTNSNLLFLFFLKKEARVSKERQERERGDPSNDIFWRICTNLEIGLAASAIGIAANTIGMRTGFCRCIDHDALPGDILEPYNINKYNLEVMLGVGYPLYQDHTMHTDGKHFNSSFPKTFTRKLII